MEEIKFIRELEDIKLTEVGSSFTFECEISKDGLKLDWYKGETKLKRGDKYDIVADGKVHRLVIDKVSAEFAGKYSAAYEKLKTTGKLTLAGELLLISSQKYKKHIFLGLISELAV